MNLQHPEQGKLAAQALQCTVIPTSRERLKPTVSTLQALVVARRGVDLDPLMLRLRKQTCEAYVQYGVGSQQYEQSFDDLHWCRIARMAMDVRAARGLPPDARTPYDNGELAVWLNEVRTTQNASKEVSA